MDRFVFEALFHHRAYEAVGTTTKKNEHITCFHTLWPWIHHSFIATVRKTGAYNELTIYSNSFA